jgi:hypothetical protein
MIIEQTLTKDNIAPNRKLTRKIEAKTLLLGHSMEQISNQTLPLAILNHPRALAMKPTIDTEY